MAALLCGIGLLAQEQTPSSAAMAAAAKSTTQETCRIAGMVLKLTDGTPLKNATVQLENGDDHEHTIAAKTAADGRYELRNVPSGRYKLKVTRVGYVAMEYGQRKPSDPGATLTLSPGANKEQINFQLIPAAVITGRIFDADGEPMQNAVVLALRETYDQGRRILQSVSAQRTDDLGKFRLFGLAAGRYFVSALLPESDAVIGDRDFIAGDQQDDKAYVRTYYPGAQDAAEASEIAVKEGEEVAGVDVQLKQVPVYRIRGRVVNLITHKGEGDTYLQLIRRSNHFEWNLGGGQQVVKSDGSFELPNVAPGSYLLLAVWSNEEKTYSTREKIDIGEGDVEGVTLVLGSGVTIPGYVRWHGKPSLDGELKVSVEPADTVPAWGSDARVQANQQFMLKDVGDGDDRVSVTGLSKDCYIQDMVYGETHSADGLIAVTKGSGQRLDLTISSRGAQVEGAVVDEKGLPAAGVWVVAVPEEAKRTNLRLFKAQTTDQYGKFDLHGLAPGSYKLFSWAAIENNAWQDGNFLKPFEKKGVGVELTDGEVRTVTLKTLATKSE